MAYADLTNETNVILPGTDSIVIRDYKAGIKNGRTLDVTDFTEKVIQAGHIVIKDSATGEVYKPMPVKDGEYDSLPGDYEYAGVVVGSVPASKPIVGIMYSGEVNDKVVPFSVDAIKADLKEALPTLVFMHD